MFIYMYIFPVSYVLYIIQQVLSHVGCSHLCLNKRWSPNSQELAELRSEVEAAKQVEHLRREWWCSAGCGTLSVALL